MGIRLSINLTQKSQDIANNTSTVTASVIANYNGGTYNRSGNNGTLTLNGQNYSFHGTFNMGMSKESGTTTMYTVTATVPHNSDGSKTVSASVSYPTVTWGTLTASNSLKLTQIPRKATVVSAPDFNDEENPTITYSNPAGSAVTSLKACISLTGAADDIAYRDISKTGTSYTFNLTEAERSVLRKATASSNSRTVRFYVQTVISGVTNLHYLEKTLTIVNAKPSLSPTVVDVDSVMLGLTGNSSRIVKYYSNPKYTVNATALKGASISSYKVTCGSQVLTTATGTFYDVESGSISLTATDTRGNSTTKTVSLTLVNYVKLTCNPTFSPPSTSGSMSFTIRGNYFSGSFGSVSNTLTVQYRYKYTTDAGTEVGWSNWTSVSPTISGTTYTVTPSLSGLNYLYSYTFQARAVDKIATVESAEKTIQTLPVFDWGKNDFNINGNLGFSGKGTVLRRNGDNGNIVLSAPDATDGIFLRPSGSGSSTGQAILSKAGNLTVNGNVVATGSLNGASLSLSGSASVKSLTIDGRQFGAQKILWTGVWYMTANHTVQLAESINKQPNGIVLTWSGYASGAAENSYIQHFFIPKEYLVSADARGVCLVLAKRSFSTIGTKYVYVNDNTIVGHESNNASGTANGITYNNASFVLRCVWGV